MVALSKDVAFTDGDEANKWFFEGGHVPIIYEFSGQLSGIIKLQEKI
jgi:hypothetical protein